eukprot:7101998-Prymnesium_polylepis.1
MPALRRAQRAGQAARTEPSGCCCCLRPRQQSCRAQQHLCVSSRGKRCVNSLAYPAHARDNPA